MSKPEDEAVAIVGYGGVFPGAGDPEGLWANIVEAVDATTEVPPGRWLLAPAQAFDPRIPQPDKVSATRGGFVGEVALDLAGLNLDPALVRRLDPVFHLALHAAHTAWKSSRTESLDRDRVGVIFGNIVLPTEGSSSFSRAVLGRFIEEGLGITAPPGEATEPLNAFPAGLPAALVAQALGLRGTQFTLDAACASSLYALKLAVDELRSGRADAMITGGVSRPDPLYTQMGFSQLLALSARGKPAPFDVKADGLVVGEGAGLFVLKRLSDAVRQGDAIHAVIRGIGLSNDIHGDLLAPSSEGQLRAMQAAYQQAGWSPWDVDLIECHATGTPVGDAVEVDSLKRLWGDRGSGWSPGQCTIGSVKSNVGHMLTAAGAAGLVKVLLAFKHETLPPTANQTQPSPRLRLEGSPFRILTNAQPWPHRDPARPRRAALSGFGFGGINAHVLIEEWSTRLQRKPGPKSESAPQSSAIASHPARPARPPRPVAIVGMAAHFGPFADLRAVQEQVLSGETGGEPVPPRRWWGAAGNGRAESGELAPGRFPGYYLDAVRLRVDQFRIPPRELQEMLPQQSLMLTVAAEAIADARWGRGLGGRTGVVIGLGLDQNTNNYQLRWWLADQAPIWNRKLDLGLSEAELEGWIDALRQAVGPPLTANRTMGSLGGLVASRIAREFRIGGPSFSVACDETSGTQALQIAAGWLELEELDAAIVGAVDLAGDMRAVLAANQVAGPAPPGEGAAALVLKRLDDALRDGDRVYAIVRDAKAVTCRSIGPADPDDATLSSHGAMGSVRSAIGRPGAATGLAAVVRAALCLYQQIIPGHRQDARDRGGPQFWLRNRAEGPRRAEVRTFGLGGTCHTLILEAVEDAVQPRGVVEIERAQPLGARRLAVFALEADDRRRLIERIAELIALAGEDPDPPIERLARRWWSRCKPDPSLQLGMAVIAGTVCSLRRGLDKVVRMLREGRDIEAAAMSEADVEVIPPRLPLGSPACVAFVYPGLGNVFAGMGRELSALWPEVCRAQDARLEFLRDQFLPDVWWNAGLPARFDDHRVPILGQVAVSSLATEVLSILGVAPAAAIGYSMGESAALVALHAWTDRDALARDLASSPLFATELAGPCYAARRVWQLDAAEPVDWVAGIVSCSPADLEAALVGRARVYVLICNTSDETVIGGQRRAVRELLDALGCSLLELPIVSTVHCEIGRAVESDYRALHDQPTAAPEGLLFYSGVSGRAYHPDRLLAAEAITAQATRPIDFPAVIDQAYAAGFRVFLEMGPGGSCTRLIGRILADRPHLAHSVCLPVRDPLGTVLEALAKLIAYRIPVDLEPLYGRKTLAVGLRPDDHDRPAESDRLITIDLGPKPPELPLRPTRRQDAPAINPRSEIVKPVPVPVQVPVPGMSPLIGQLVGAEVATASAHEAFLSVSHRYGALIGRNLEYQLGLIEALSSGVPWEGEAPAEHHFDQARQEPRPPENEIPCVLDRAQCLEFAIGSIAAVLGNEYATIDGHPTRVRLPDEPLMLVDRIVTIEGEPRSLSSGRVVTEHDILAGDWYLDAGRIPPSIAIESGQADLFLSGYLGIDFVTKGLAVYRLLDATVTFHRGLPGPGESIRYDIKITRFFRQGDTHLFRFEFDGTVGGEPLLTMRDGCAGFFSAAELAAGKGIVPRPLDSRHRAGVRPPDWTDLVPVARLSLDERQVEALRRGDLAAGFGPPFDKLDLADPLPLPGGRMTLVHRVETLDPGGGRFGLGVIRAEADIHPGDWFMVCHFVDDHVMPGTLMYECCLHTLRIFLMRLGWVGASGQVAFEPVPGVANRLRCRGQVIESTRKVVYEVVIKELGYGPEPFAIADALMYADGKPIVEITDMALRLVGTNRQGLEQLWLRCHESGSRSRAASVVSSSGHPAPKSAGRGSSTARSRFWRSRRASPRRDLAIATGSSTTAGSSPGFPDLPTSSWTGLSAWKASPGRWPREPRPRRNTTSRTMPGTSRQIVKSAFRTQSCWRRRSRRAAG